MESFYFVLNKAMEAFQIEMTLFGYIIGSNIFWWTLIAAHSSGVCSTSFWGDTMNKLPYFLVALCLCMFCSFSAYADDRPGR